MPTRSRHASDLGRHGEALAEAHLVAAGYRILGRNVRAGRGEIDLVAWHRGEIVFVEVKTRRPGRWGGPGEAVSVAKLRALARAGRAWLRDHGGEEQPCRFDVVLIVEDASRTDGSVEIIEAAAALGDYLE